MKLIAGSLFILTLCTSSFFSCQKKEEQGHRKIEGIVLHAVTAQPMANEMLTIHVTEKRQVGPANAEFPNGQYISALNNYTVVTNQEGRYSIQIQYPSNELIHPYIELKSSQYIRSRNQWGYFTGTPSISADSAGFIYIPVSLNIFDTIYVEKPAYVRYTIKNEVPDFDNDTLFVSTPYSMKFNYPERLQNDMSYFYAVILGNRYNWVFSGIAVDTVITDTIPGERISNPEVSYYHKRADSILFKKETISVRPNQTTNYFISY